MLWIYWQQKCKGLDFTFSLDDTDCISELVSFICDTIEESGHKPESTDIVLWFYTGSPSDIMPREFLANFKTIDHLFCNRSLSQAGDNTSIMCNKMYNRWHKSIFTPRIKVRGFSTTTSNYQAHQSVVNIISQAETSNFYKDGRGSIIPNVDSQSFIERLSIDQFNMNMAKVRLIADVDSSVLGGVVSKYVMDREDQLMVYIDRLRTIVSEYVGDDPFKLLIKAVFNVVSKEFIRSACLHTFLIVLSYRETTDHYDKDMVKHNSLLTAAVRLGKSVVRKYLGLLKDIELKYIEVSDRPRYSVWVEGWYSSHPEFKELLKDTDRFYSELGCKLIEALEGSELLRKDVVRTSYKAQHYELFVYDNYLNNSFNVRKMYSIPNKMPMIVKPKSYDHNSLGGYLLNDV